MILFLGRCHQTDISHNKNSQNDYKFQTLPQILDKSGTKIPSLGPNILNFPDSIFKDFVIQISLYNALTIRPRKKSFVALSHPTISKKINKKLPIRKIPNFYQIVVFF